MVYSIPLKSNLFKFSSGKFEWVAKSDNCCLQLNYKKPWCLWKNIHVSDEQIEWSYPERRNQFEYFLQIEQLYMYFVMKECYSLQFCSPYIFERTRFNFLPHVYLTLCIRSLKCNLNYQNVSQFKPKRTCHSKKIVVSLFWYVCNIVTIEYLDLENLRQDRL